jgi:phosphatidylglycerophosphate synthase
MASVIAGAFVLNALFPTLPGLFYLVMAIVCGGLILLISKRIAKRTTDAISDERTEKNSVKAAALTNRATFLFAIAGSCILPLLPNKSNDIVAVSRVFIVFCVFQALFQTIAYLVIDRRGR